MNSTDLIIMATKLLTLYLLLALIVSTSMQYIDNDDPDKDLFRDVILYFSAMLLWPVFLLWIFTIRIISKIKLKNNHFKNNN